MGGVSSWCDLLVNGPDRVRLAGAADRRRRDGRPPTFELPRTPARSGAIEVWSEELPAAAGARGAPTRGAGELPADPRAQPARLGGRHRRGASTPGSGAAGIPAACAASSAPAAAGRRSWTRCARCSTSASPRPARRRRSTSSRRRTLYQTLYWVARTAAAPTPADRRAARHRRGLVGDPRASSTRRCTARRWCSPSTASTCARPTWPPRAAATRRAAASPRRAWRAAWRAPPTRAPTWSRR